ncbi:hypothetical protein [Paracoccus luteus]|uniref:hypothetical protein n=1 Tax=Paracoccus luteus TaxID=2508543 RepID=UPI0010705CFA|nr:hypothetical protein [Paracoccus luteus]
MTALAQYQRLESSGVWRPSPDDRLRDVVVAFGDATLILRDPRSEEPLSHWSLPAVTRLNPGQRPAIFAPGGTERDEVLEIDDTLMVDAIERIHTAISAGRPRPGRVRGGMMLALAAVALVAAAVWMPGAIQRHAARISPPAQQVAIGNQILADLRLATGPECSRAAGSAVLDRLAGRLLGPQGRIVVLPATLRGARALPGRMIVIGDDLIAGKDDPAIAAGHVLAADEVANAHDPLLGAIQRAGTRAAIEMLTAGEMPAGALAGYGQTLLAGPVARPADEALLARMEQAGVPSEPYARSLDPTGESVLPLIEADPFRTAPPARPILSAGEWVQLQQICSI